MSDSDICFYDSSKKAFTAGDPDSTFWSSWGVTAKSDTTASAFKTLDPHTVRVNVDGAHGSGVVLEGKDRIGTDAHVALFGQTLEIETYTGKKLAAIVTNFDIVTDTATLYAPGLNKDGATPAEFNIDAASTINKPGNAVGFPAEPPKDGPTKCISSGKITEVTSLEQEWVGKGSAKDNPPPSMFSFAQAWGQINRYGAAYILQNPDSPKFADQYEKRQIMNGDIIVQGGMSGGALAGLDNRVFALTDKGGYDGKVVATPVGQLLDLAQKPPRFDFKYEWGPHPRLLGVEALDESGKYEAGLANALIQKPSYLLKKVN